jgi:hypothetical protein
MPLAARYAERYARATVEEVAANSGREGNQTPAPPIPLPAKSAPQRDHTGDGTFEY